MIYSTPGLEEIPQQPPRRVAQLRDLLDAERSAEVAQEDEQERLARPQLA